jgi:hypothetical protein
MVIQTMDPEVEEMSMMILSIRELIIPTTMALVEATFRVWEDILQHIRGEAMLVKVVVCHRIERKDLDNKVKQSKK